MIAGSDPLTLEEEFWFSIVEGAVGSTYTLETNGVKTYAPNLGGY